MLPNVKTLEKYKLTKPSQLSIRLDIRKNQLCRLHQVQLLAGRREGRRRMDVGNAAKLWTGLRLGQQE